MEHEAGDLNAQITGMESELEESQVREVELRNRASWVSSLDAALQLLDCQNLELEGKIAEILAQKIEDDDLIQSL